MSGGIVEVAKPTNEYPDIIGYRPEDEHVTEFHPYIPAEAHLRELTLLPLLIGTLLGIVFGASSLYLVLKVGLTVSASIPVAVISISLFSLLSKFGLRNATILENNIVQTAGSAGESIAFGIGVTMPAIMILGFDLEVTRVMLVAVLGGLLGILMMIPLRRALIVQQHGKLKYPEGTACAEVLKVGASEESRRAASEAAKAEWARANEGQTEAATNTGAKTIFTGFGIGFIYYVIERVLFAWKEIPNKVFGAPLKAGSIGAEISPALLGVGYIIGPRIASIMAAGGVLAYLVLIPAIAFFGDKLTSVLPPGDTLIGEMKPDDIRGAYILYIGAGAVAAGGIISLMRSLPTIWSGLKGGLRDLRGSHETTAAAPRTDQDLSMKWVIGGIILLLVLIVAFRTLHMNILGAILIVVFGFLFVTVSSRLTGEIGSSSNPISGMTVATLLLTCLIFLIIGWTGPIYYVTALSVGAIVCIAASNGGTTSQDLKTGYLVGSTPKYQQIAILVGALASALVLGPILLGLNNGATVYVPATTLQPMITEEEPDKIITLPAGAVTAPYTGDVKPNKPGNYRVFMMFKDLGPGSYLVDETTGKIAYEIENNVAEPVSETASKVNLGQKSSQLPAYEGEERPVFHLFSYTGTPAINGLQPGDYLVDEATRRIAYRLNNGKAEPVSADVAQAKTGKKLSDLPVYEGAARPTYRLFTYGAKPDPKDDKNKDLKDGEYLVNEQNQIAYAVEHNFSADLRVNTSQLAGTEKLQGPQAETDNKTYRVLFKTDEASGNSKRYLVEDLGDGQGVVRYMVDPGINGTHKYRPDETSVTKFDAPKATLMSYIIKGILDRRLPWALVLLGVMIAIVLEMSGIPSLAFAVGVYLPLSSSSPIFIGGMIRWLVDRHLRQKFKGKNLTEEELTAEGDKSPGVLMASGYIAGGALAGIVIAFMAGVLTKTTKGIENWSVLHNPFYDEVKHPKPYADLLSVVPFAILAILLYLAGREVILASRRREKR